MTHAVILGARGYLGRELVRLLDEHPHVDEVTPVSSSANGAYGDAVPTFAHTDLRFHPLDEAASMQPNLVFDASGTVGQDLEAMPEGLADAVHIDLSRQHRLTALQDDGWHYGLADALPTPRGQRRIANPGCYPTATLLAAWPLLATELVAPGPLIVDGKSGVSGAGAQPRSDLHFPEMNESVRAYNVLGHDHQGEIEAAIAQVDHAPARPVRFTPHLVPQTRGLLATVYIPVTGAATAENVRRCYEEAYAEAPFVHLVDEADTGNVRGSNHAHVAVDLDEDTRLVVARCAIDNLVKGGAGTAVQNANDAMGWPTDAGLDRAPGGL
ncbi:MAG: N-acetyl-gamma-glutamyl-phosphate reductase [Thermoplasmatota archaeon]